MNNEKKETGLEELSNELADMTVNDFSNLIDKHDLGIDIIDDLFYQLREAIYEERNKNNG
tara:strand:- start:604 stop:783 length:180 start_codon:yes stop_codon:yes gene_type:complete